MLSDDMVRAFALAGDSGIWAERLKAIEAMGTNLPVVFPMVADRIGMIRRLGAELLPRFRG